MQFSWKERTNRLIEERVDPDEFAQAQKERDEAQRKLTSATNDATEVRNDLAQTNSQLVHTRTELGDIKKQVRCIPFNIMHVNYVRATVVIIV